MAKGSSYQYLDLAKPILPYRSYTSPVDESPHFIQGSQNILASQIGYLEKRPGFSNQWGVADGHIDRIFGWRRWSGSFFTMLSSTVGGVATVWKKEIGVDTDFTQIWTSTSAIPFDFVVSDNFCFFGNSTDMRKYDGTTVSKWGCDAPPTAPDVSLLSGVLPAGITATGNTISGIPTVPATYKLTVDVTDSVGATTSKTFNFVVAPATINITTPSILPEIGTSGGPYTITFAQQFGVGAITWAIFSGTIPTGMSFNTSTGVLSGTPSTPGPYTFAIEATDTTPTSVVKSFSLYVENPGTLSVSPSSPLATGTVGTPYSNTLTVSGGTGPYTISYLSSSGSVPPEPFNTLPQGLTFTPSGSTVALGGTPSQSGSWAFRLLVLDSAGHSLVFDYSIIIQATTVTIDTVNFPIAYVGHAYSTAIFVEGGTAPYSYIWTAGSLDGQTGYIYGYSYTTIYGHESNVSALSKSTGIFTSQDPAILLVASADPQVNGINLYRTTDGGVPDPAIMRLVASLPNTNQTYVDSTLDIDLGTQTGPGFLINTPPTPCRGFVWSNGRIYGMVDNKTYYSGLEEVNNGIPEEAWPSGLDGNFYAWPAQVGGMAVTENGVDVGISEQFWQVSGDSLDTFRKSLLIDKAGVGSPTCINAVGNSVQWFDSAKQIWSSSLGEIGEPIRVDLANTASDTSFIGYHKSGNFNWIYLLDTINQKMFVYDLDTDQWYPPWTVAATAIWSGETSVGTLSLLAAFGPIVFSLVPNTYQDAGNNYEDDLKTNLIPISPGRTTSARSKIEPSQMEEILFEMEGVNYVAPFPSLVAQLGDENPITADFDEWFDMTGNSVTPQYIPVRKKLVQQRFIADSETEPAIRTAFWIQFAPLATGWKIYSLTISWIRSNV